MISEPRDELVFEAALELPAEQRAAYLDQTCAGNVDLRQRVEALLGAFERAGGFMKEPAVELPAQTVCTPALPTEKPGDRIGRYKLLQQIGEGGCGVVYMAEQEEPVRRRVALKVIKLGMDTKQVIARFEAERQALALMGHPNIARALDAGATESGRPFFVMELVRGLKITDFCDQKKLSFRERLELFIPVCQAIQHAHQKGILHRDLKPSNILVTTIDGVAVPKVIDFGIAKATNNQWLTDQTLFTAFEQFIGTPAYMSPEQAELSGVDVDTRTDIYSLGVVLYELLTGKTPFDAQELLRGGLDEIRRTIRETEPPKPSTRLHTLAEAELTTVAQARQADAPRLVHQVRGDLDWVVMKCLEKDRNRRYETANGLATDLQRHLQNEPVAARPPGTAYRFQKFVRRNKLAFASGAIVVSVLLVGIAASTWQAIRATRAEREQSQLRQQAEAARAGEAEQRKRAETQEALTRQQLYTERIRVAHRAWEDGAIARMNEALDGLQPSGSQEDLRGFEWYLLKGYADRKGVVLEHGAHARAVAFSPDGQFLATGGSDTKPRQVTVPTEMPRPLVATQEMQIVLWRVADGAKIRTFPGHLGWVNDLAFSRDGRFLVSAGFDQRVKIWSVDNGELAGELAGHTNEVSSVAFSPDGKLIATASGQPRAGLGANQIVRFAMRSPSDEEVFLWNWATRELIRRWPAHKHGVLSVAFSPDSRTLATAGLDGAARLWSVTDGATQAHLDSGLGLFSIAFSPDGKSLGLSGANKSVLIWKPEGGELRHIPVGRSHTFTVAFSADGKTLAVGGEERMVKLIDVHTGHIKSVLPGHLDCVWRVAFAPDGVTLASAGWDGAIRFWDTEKTADYRTFSGGQGSLCLDFSKDGKLLCKDAGGNAEVWDAQSLERITALPMPSGGEIRQIKFSPQGTALAAVNNVGELTVWDAKSWRERFSVETKQALWGLAYSSDGKTVVTGSVLGEVKCWDSETGELQYAFPPLMNFVRGLSFSPDGQTLAVVGRLPGDAKVRTLHMWSWESRKLEAECALPFTGEIAYSPDGKCFAIGSVEDGRLQLWDTNPLRMRQEIKAHNDVIWNIAFSPDSRTLATASWDGTFRLWHVFTGAELFSLKREAGDPNWAVAFSPVGHQLLTAGGGSRRFAIWEAEKVVNNAAPLTGAGPAGNAKRR